MQDRKTLDHVTRMFEEKRVPLMRADIVRVKTRAVRRGVWFRALTRAERACVDLAVMVV